MTVSLKRFYSNSAFQTLKVIKNQSLIQTSPFINGKFTNEMDAIKFDVTNPFDGSKLIEINATTNNELSKAFQVTKNAFFNFKTFTPKQRALMLRKLNESVIANSEDLAKLITLENGKPLKDSMGEVLYGASFLEWFADEACRINGSVIDSAFPNKKIVSLREPIGPVGILTPWNFPLAMITRKLGAALAAGCSVIIKPAADTPLTALAFAKICQDANIPDGLINITPVEEKRTSLFGKMFCESPELRKISFTGSTRVGSLLLEQCASTVKKVSMELGGNAPFIVSNMNSSHELSRAVDELIAGKFRSSGQTCVCVNRIYIHEEVYDEFVELLVSRLKETVRLGPGMDPTVTHGPLVHRRAVDKVDSLVQDAVSKGAKVLLGGKRRDDLGPSFYEMTVLGGVTDKMKIYETEIFGPVAAICPYNDTMENICRKASQNIEDVGLAGYIFSSSREECRVGSSMLDVGMVGVNTGLISEAVLPFGGVRRSGFGREGSVFGVDEYTVVKSIVERI